MALEKFVKSAREARFYAREEGGSVKCNLCVNACLIKPGEAGACAVRFNDSGTLRSLVHGRVAAMHLAPSEIKPFFHFMPGALWLSVGTIGCNLRCKGCQNWPLAHSDAHPGLLGTEEETAGSLTEKAQRARCAGLSFTYNEPTVWLEFTIEASVAANARGLRSTYVSNGMMSSEALEELVEHIDAFRFDVKAFSRETLRKITNLGDWEQVKRNAEFVAGTDKHLEIVTNVIPGVNDELSELSELASWIKGGLGQDVPWHITRFHPSHEMLDFPSTPVETLEKIHEAGKNAGLDYVYIGNVPGHASESTYCPECGKLAIERQGVFITRVALDGSRCTACGHEIPIVAPPESFELKN